MGATETRRSNVLVGLSGISGSVIGEIECGNNRLDGGDMAGGKYLLYGRRGAGSLAPQILLEEIGAPYELIWVGKTAAELETLRRVNPAGKIPSLVLPNGTAVAESAAILIHLTNAHPSAALAPPAGSTAHARFLQWMVFMSANLYDAVLRYYYSERYSTSGAEAAPAIKAQALADCGAHLERIHAELSPYVLGDKFSAVDPYLHMLTGWYPEDAQQLAARMPKLAQHAELLRKRPATLAAERAHAED